MDIPNPAAITVAPTSLPFTLIPVIHDLVRTRFPVPGSIFLVEDIQVCSLTQTGRWQVVRLILGDGRYCIQAILADAMHRLVHGREVAVGSYVRVEEFQLRLRNYEAGSGKTRQMLFLVVYDINVVGWNDDVRRLHVAQNEPPALDKGKSPLRESTSAGASPASSPTKRSSVRSGHRHPDVEQVDDADNKGHLFEKAVSPMKGPVSTPASAAGTPVKKRVRRGDRADHGGVSQDENISDAFEEFETLTFPPRKPSSSPSKPIQVNKGSKQTVLPIALPRDWHDLQTPLKLTTLRSVPNLPYRQNWSCNVLAILATLSPIETSNLPPYKQRTARLMDPSTAKRVHLTVFLDPEEFTPSVGSAVLLTGVKNHRFDGGSLKKYASDRRGGRWWFEDPWELGWCDVKGIKDWWTQMEAYAASRASEENPG
ncbi:hypothetical protein QQS21_004572 [Conoideocrella luteorostrata]|uniref:Cyclin-like F-box n=1 Tax=Conoideocrella luteorostrata TaxID=1105319 RepID=A0AAJ0CR43_9HYPO|nr:hypothetical protein QQS21_004572 [Conoideocrella luteorostrata]